MSGPHEREWLQGAKVPPGSIRLELVGIAEISAEFGVPRTTASMWHVRRATSGFPLPVKVLEMGPVFDMAQVRAWHAEKYPPRRDPV